MISSGEIRNLGEFVKQFSFVVPDYQRGYEWEPRNISDFHNTLRDLISSNRQDFLGSFIVKRETESTTSVEVVDGQQRLTTVFLYLAVIRDQLTELESVQLPPAGLAPHGKNVYYAVNDLFLNNEKTNYRLKPNELVQDVFQNFIAPEPKDKQPLTQKQKTAYSRDLRRAHKIINELIVADLSNSDGVKYPDDKCLVILDRIFSTLFHNFRILPIFCGDDSEALEVFMTMNTKGIRLAASDIIKSNIFKGMLSGAPSKNRAALSQATLARWTQFLENLEAVNVDQAIRHYFLARSKDTFRVRDLISITQAEIDKEPFGKEHNANQLLEDLVSMSETYKQLLGANYQFPNLENSKNAIPKKSIESINESLLILSRINQSSRVLTLALLHPLPKFEISECVNILSTVEKLTMCWQLAGLNAQKLEDLFQGIAFKLDQGLIDSQEIIESLLSNFPETERVRAELVTPISDAGLARVLLFRIHQFLGDADRFLEIDPEKSEVEHIAPRSPTPEWLSELGCGDSDGIQQYEYLVELLGNKTLLDSKINNALRQRNFADKKTGFEIQVKSKLIKYPGFRNSAVEETRDLVNLEDWNAAEIQMRTEWIADCAITVFGAGQNLEDLMPYSEWRSLKIRTSNHAS